MTAPDREKMNLGERIPVESSNLKAVAYSASYETLEIEFHGGRVYWYQGVPERIYEGLMSASSKGSYHHNHIKWNFPYTRYR